MFNILTYARVAPATADAHIILELIRFTLRTGRVWPELSQTMGCTTHRTVNRVAHKQLHFKYVVPEGTKGASNLRNISLNKLMEGT